MLKVGLIWDQADFTQCRVDPQSYPGAEDLKM